VSELSLADQIGDKSQVTGEPEVILKLALMGVPPGSNENAPNGLGGDQWRSPRTGLLSRNNFRFARHPGAIAQVSTAGLIDGSVGVPRNTALVVIGQTWLCSA